MKRIVFIVLFVLSIMPCLGQEEIYIKFGHLPNLQYTQTEESTIVFNLSFIASEEILQELKKNGVENPAFVEDSSRTQSLVTTGDLIGNQFQIDIELLETNNPALPIGTKFFGKSIDGRVVIDSISSSALNAQEKELILNSMESILNQVQLPERLVKIGESFEQILPMTFPIGPMVLDMEIINNYTLTKIANGLGYFDLKQDMVLKSNFEDVEMRLDGTGEGHMEYDIKNQFFTKYAVEMEMNMTMELEEFTMELQGVTTMLQTSEVGKAVR